MSAISAAFRTLERHGYALGGAPDDPGTPLKAPVAQDAFQSITGRSYGSAPTDLPLLGKGDVTMPPGMKPEHFGHEVDRLRGAVKDWNDPQRRFWYENSGNALSEAVGRDPEMADRLTMGVAKTSQQTSVPQNMLHAATAHHQFAAGEPVRAGLFPNAMGAAIQKAYEETEPGAVGPKISGYQSGFRTAWRPEVMNAGANDIHNMRQLGWKGWNKAATTGQHNYDRLMRSAVTHVLNSEGYDGGEWKPGQVQAVLWAKSRHEQGVPESEAGYDIAHAIRDRAARLTYESAPGMTSDHFPEYHDAPLALKQKYHDDINKVLQDKYGRDRIASEMGLLTLPTEHGAGVYEGKVSPGSAAITVAGGGGGWKAGVDPATRKLMTASELVRAHLLKQDAAAWHFPQFPKNGMNWDTRNLFDVRLGRQITHEEAKKVAEAMHRETGSDFFSPIFTRHGYRFINVPEASGVSNKDLQKAISRAIGPIHRENPDVVMGYNDGFYHADDWRTDNGEGYLQGLDALGPHVSGRAKRVLASLAPQIAKVEERYAKEHGWTPRGERKEGVERPEKAEGGPLKAERPPLYHAPTELHIGPIRSHVAGRTDHLPIHVPSGSYVIPADVVSAHGEGNTDAGFKVLRRVFGGTPYGQGSSPYGQSGGPYGEPLHKAAGGKTSSVPIVAAGGEYVVSPEEVRHIGDGDLETGHKVLDDFVVRSRAKTVSTLKNLPGPKKD